MAVYEVWCEWDIGLGNRAFSSEEKAKKAAQDALKLQEMDSFEVLLDEGLIGIEGMEVE